MDLDSTQYAAALRLLKNTAGCLFHAQSAKVWNQNEDTKKARRATRNTLTLLRKITPVTDAEVLEYANASGVQIVENDGVFRFDIKENI